MKQAKMTIETEFEILGMAMISRNGQDDEF